MAKLIEKLKGDPALDTTISFKINREIKEEYVKLCVKYKLSFGAVIREGLDEIMLKLKDELEEK